MNRSFQVVKAEGNVSISYNKLNNSRCCFSINVSMETTVFQVIFQKTGSKTYVKSKQLVSISNNKLNNLTCCFLISIRYLYSSSTPPHTHTHTSFPVMEIGFILTLCLLKSTIIAFVLHSRLTLMKDHGLW